MTARIPCRADYVHSVFRRTNSAMRVVHRSRNEGILWPRRVRTGVHAGELLFSALEHSRVLGVLRNPRYAGAFTAGPAPRRARMGAAALPALETRRMDRVFPNMYSRYISREEFEANQAKLLDNANGFGDDKRMVRRVKAPPFARVTPASLEVAVQVFEELRTRQAEVDRLRRAQLHRARQEAELAQRQDLRARPENPSGG